MSAGRFNEEASNFKYILMKCYKASEKQADCYLSYMNNNPVSPLKFSEICHITQDSSHKVLDALVKKGLAESLKGYKTKMFRLKNPRELFNPMREIFDNADDEVGKLEMEYVDSSRYEDVLEDTTKQFTKISEIEEELYFLKKEGFSFEILYKENSLLCNFKRFEIDEKHEADIDAIIFKKENIKGVISIKIKKVGKKLDVSGKKIISNEFYKLAVISRRLENAIR